MKSNLWLINGYRKSLLQFIIAKCGSSWYWIIVYWFFPTWYLNVGLPFGRKKTWLHIEFGCGLKMSLISYCVKTGCIISCIYQIVLLACEGVICDSVRVLIYNFTHYWSQWNFYIPKWFNCQNLFLRSLILSYHDTQFQLCVHCDGSTSPLISSISPNCSYWTLSNIFFKHYYLIHLF